MPPKSADGPTELLRAWSQGDPAALEPVVDAVIAENAAKAAEYRAGKTGLLGFFVGQVMRRTGGSANPELVRGLVETRLTR
jgi:glutaminyl-tRNA synthetase